MYIGKLQCFATNVVTHLAAVPVCTALALYKLSVHDFY